MFDSCSPYQPPTGLYLGDLQSELHPDEEIVDFVACAHKSYSMKIKNNKTEEETDRQKNKGKRTFYETYVFTKCL